MTKMPFTGLKGEKKHGKLIPHQKMFHGSLQASVSVMRQNDDGKGAGCVGSIEMKRQMVRRRKLQMRPPLQDVARIRLVLAGVNTIRKAIILKKFIAKEQSRRRQIDAAKIPSFCDQTDNASINQIALDVGFVDHFDAAKLCGCH